MTNGKTFFIRGVPGRGDDVLKFLRRCFPDFTPDIPKYLECSDVIFFWKDTDEPLIDYCAIYAPLADTIIHAEDSLELKLDPL